MVFITVLPIFFFNPHIGDSKTMAKEPVIDKGTCIGCGLCAQTAANTFKMCDDAKAEISNPGGDDEATIQSAIDACPVQAITWKE